MIDRTDAHLSPHSIACALSFTTRTPVFTVSATHAGRWAPLLTTKSREVALAEYVRLRDAWCRERQVS